MSGTPIMCPGCGMTYRLRHPPTRCEYTEDKFNDAEEQMKVYVVMGNDYPDAVLDTEAKADAYVAKMKAEEAKKKPHERKIYWRHCSFELQQTKNGVTT